MDYNSDLLASVRRRFRPAEMMLLAGSAMGRKLDAANFVDQVCKDISESSVFALMIEQGRINTRLLDVKLRSMSRESLDVLVARLDDWQTLPVGEMMAHNHFPSAATLARLGLVEPSGVAAWGIVTIRTNSAIYEFILRHPERMRGMTETQTVDDCALRLLREIEDSSSPMYDETVLDAVYRLVKITGWRRCLVVADDGRVRVTEVRVEDLLQGIYEHNLQGVVLAGVNAPDVV